MFKHSLVVGIIRISNYFTNTSWIKKIQDIYFLLILGILPWLSFTADKNFAGISLSAIFFLISTLLLSLLYIIKLKKYLVIKKNRMQFLSLSKIDLFILLIAIYNFVFMIYKLACGKLEYDRQIIIVGLCFFYFLISRFIEFNIKYLYFFSFILMPIAIIYVMHFLFNLDILPIFFKSKNTRQDLISIFLVQVVVCIILFCKEKNKVFSKITFFLGTVYIFCLFLLQNVVSIWLAGILFFILPLFFWPTAELVKKNVQFAFTYFFLLSNMSLLKAFFHSNQTNYEFITTISLYIDLCIAIGGTIFFAYWEKLPPNCKRDKIVMPKIRKWCRHIVLANIIMGMSLFVLMIKKGQLLEVASHTFLYIINESLRSVIELKGLENISLLGFGIPGTVVTIMFIAKVGLLIRKNFNADDNFSQICTFLSVFYFIYSIFFTQNLIITPFFIVFISHSIYPSVENKKIKKMLRLDKNAQMCQREKKFEEASNLIENKEIKYNAAFETCKEAGINIIDLDIDDNL